MYNTSEDFDWLNLFDYGIDRHTEQYVTKTESGFLHKSKIGNYAFETKVYTNNNKSNGDVKIKNKILKKYEDKYKKISIRDVFVDDINFKKLIYKSLILSIRENLKFFINDEYMFAYPLSAYQWDYYFNKNNSDIIINFDKFGYYIDITSNDIVLVIKYILPANTDEFGNRFIKANYFDDSIKAFDRQYDAIISIFDIKDYIKDNSEIIDILDEFKNRTLTKNIDYSKIELPDRDNNGAFVGNNQEEDCGCGGV